MAVNLVIPVPEIAAIFDAASAGTANTYDQFRLYRATSRGATYSLVDTVALVESDTSYSYLDTGGDNTSWYKITFRNSTSTDETLLAEAEPFQASRDLLTLQELRRTIIKNLGGEVEAGTSMGADSVLISALIDSARDSKWFNGWHIYRPAATSTANQDRRVEGYNPDTGTITHGGASWNSTGNETMELLPVDIPFNVLNTKIGKGLTKARFLYRYEFGATAGQRQYSLPGFIEGAEWVPDAWFRRGITSDQYVWEKFESFGRWWKIRGSSFQCVLDINPSMADNDVIGLDVWRPGEALEGETDFTTVHPTWAEAAAMVGVLEYLVTRDLARHNKTSWDKLFAFWSGELRKAARTYGPTSGLRIQVPQPVRTWTEI